MIVEKSLTSAQRDDLRVISGMMIPESDEYKVPGADDAAIQGDIIATLGRDTKMVAAALDHAEPGLDLVRRPQRGGPVGDVGLHGEGKFPRRRLVKSAH